MGLLDTSTIDTGFPLAGQDNSSQGFRDNFGAIHSLFNIVSEELDNLGANVVRVNQQSIFQTSPPVVLQSPTFKAAAYLKTPPSSLEVITSQLLIVNFFNGSNYQVYKFQQPTVVIQIENTGWPQSGYLGKMTLELSSLDPAGTLVTLQTTGTILRDDTKFNESPSWTSDGKLPVASSSSSNRRTLVELWSHQSGNVVFARNLGVYK